jgi:diacylglycerol kinase (ATP)
VNFATWPQGGSSRSGVVAVVFNPAAGARRLRRLERAVAALEAAGIRAEVLRTAGPGDATLMARAAAAAGARVVVAAGGDGTIAEVAGGIAGSGAALAVWPMGTANVLAHEWALPFKAQAFAAMVAAGQTRLLHPGLATFADGRERLFVQMLGVGFDAAVVAAVTPRLKRRLGKGAYVVQTVLQAFRNAHPWLAARVDGRDAQASSVIITKGRLYAGRFTLSPQARPDAAGFRAVLFARRGLAAIALYGLALPLGLLPRLASVQDGPADTASVAMPPGVAVQADGDAAGVTPVQVRDAPPIPLVVP